MKERGDGYSFTLGVHDFDTSLLPVAARTPGTDAFAREVTRFFTQEYAALGGFTRIVVGPAEIEVTWTPDPKKPDPVDTALKHVNKREYCEAIRLLTALERCRPDDYRVLYNLGLALSDTGDVARAEDVLRRAEASRPGDSNARIGLAVALARQEKTPEATELLKGLVQENPVNPWVLQNLGACLVTLGQLAEAEPYLRQAAALRPNDQGCLFGLAQVLSATGRADEADDYYQRVIRLDRNTAVAEAAEQARSRRAREVFRSKTGDSVRPDAVMYLQGALQRFAAMSPDQVRSVGLEIAVLGERGLDVNDPTRKYQLKTLPGSYSGLHCVCLMYVAFKQVAPTADIGFDLSAEYAEARELMGTDG